MSAFEEESTEKTVLEETISDLSEEQALLQDSKDNCNSTCVEQCDEIKTFLENDYYLHCL